MTWAYFYFMKLDPAVRDVAPQHARYWEQMGVPGSGRGPFSDRSGGLVVFDAADADAAAEAVANDPFQRAALLDRWWLRAWEPADME